MYGMHVVVGRGNAVCPLYIGRLLPLRVSIVWRFDHIQNMESLGTIRFLCTVVFSAT